MNKMFVCNVNDPPMLIRQRAIGTILPSFVENRKTTRFGTKSLSWFMFIMMVYKVCHWVVKSHVDVSLILILNIRELYSSNYVL